MNSFKQLYNADLKRYGKKLPRYQRKFHYFFRKSSTCKNSLLKLYYKIRFASIKRKRQIEIASEAKIGGGLYIGHAYCIIINPKAILGSNVNIHRGVLIGQENRGERAGAPIIGNNVWIGVNASIVEKVNIGDNVLIAPNSFVNRDVPSNSVVFGNPCVIKFKENATEHYINNEAEI